MKKKYLPFCVLCVFIAFLVSAEPTLADSAYVRMEMEGTARDIGTGQVFMEGGFSVNSGTGHYWAGSNYYTVNLSSGSVTSVGAPDRVLNNGAGDPFGLYDAATNAFYAGTYCDEGQSYVYVYDYNTASWSDAYGAVNIYGGDFYNGNLYYSGLRQPWTGGYDNNYISLFDFSGNSRHDALIEVGGASSHMAVDRQGNVFYAPYSFTGTSLYMWTADQVASVVNDLAGGEEDTFLGLSDGQVLTPLTGTSNGIAVDDAGNVFISLNGYSGSESAVVIWDGQTLEKVAVSAEGTYGWFGPLAIDGIFTQGDSLYGSMAWMAPITEMTAAATVPVPGTSWLLGWGLIALAGFGRRTNKIQQQGL